MAKGTVGWKSSRTKAVGEKEKFNPPLPKDKVNPDPQGDCK